MLKVAVTGATGFIGKRFLEYNQEKFELYPVSLRKNKPSETDLKGVDAIVHLAGKAHDLRNAEEREYFEVNFNLTRELADQAIKHGVSQFIYISSIKVYGEDSQDFDESSPCNPTDAYGKSKLKAEQFLSTEVADELIVSIIRPTLVYGPGVKGNVIRLLKLADKNVPLPFEGVKNLRSIVFVDNLVEMINCVILRKAEGIFVAADEHPVSTSELVELIRKGLGKKRQFIQLPAWVCGLLAKLRPELYKRLFGSLVIHNKKSCDRLYFKPPFTTEYGLKQMTDWWLRSKGLIQATNGDQSAKKGSPMGVGSN